jgi:hypothetical protein
VGNDFVGYLDELKLWSEPLVESAFDQHVLFGESFVGSHASSSTEDLVFRAGFNTAVNQGSAAETYVINSAPVRDYALYATASSFTDISEFPYSYTSVYHTSVAEIPNIGINRFTNNKIRFESQSLVSDLNAYRRSTTKSFFKHHLIQIDWAYSYLLQM